MNTKLRKSLILIVCMLPLLLSAYYGMPIVHADNWRNAITIPEDINIDFTVNLKDLAIVARAFGTTPVSLTWNPDADINNDGRINLKDIALVARNFGWKGKMPPPTTLTVSSTTSLYETGVENVLKTAFQAQYPWITINFLSQGTGAAIATAERGDADMVMVHAPSSELPFLTGGYGVNRKIIASNFFIIVGPQNDPANVNGSTPVNALKQIKTLGEEGKAIWVSRADGSGTNTKEIALWKEAGINYTQISTETSWFKSTGQGMTATLLVANELGGYTLSDTASYLTNTKNGNIQMTIVVQATQDLLNVYSVIVDNPLYPTETNTNFNAAMLFEHWLVSSPGETIIANYGTSTFGSPLFTPFLPLVANNANSTLLSWIKAYAYFNGTECPTVYRYDASLLYDYSWD